MTKTQSKSNVTAMPATKEDPSFKRNRMKKVRTMVARAVKNNQRVDLMDFEGSDIPRAMIALQDLLSKTQGRHKKATNHLAEANKLTDFFILVMNHATDALVKHQEEIGQLTTLLSQERHEHMNTAAALEATCQDADGLIREIDGLKLALKGVING